MKAKFGEATNCTLVQGRGGVFEVSVDGTPVFSKKQTGRFPQYQEIPTAILMAGLG